ncbi:hypothetical protein SAICODRAFT_105401 [Saitoella complicata NRRL Y-17804]|uniref:Wbp11/ELF5/Saf1 N-terminal domain-containing protein n=1 Tax=Saitoella complicata (strain BCRC 22490 / CBS 7301 / JCM 7358 / NBRC 10748 / NRRL Y-17804) TaxID=698492 RepID=A0A0E9ND49_SAICN|nr:uncharacterized protein SAICODRAFT_105401 [Saitoella complicata NRRL Y-17804]ODQ56260.1 hypothetical protein SAICODRAFT_105401 [Saitoella complicata NRRL Y-17804]GAO47764.1 hypothetical protein G7K_1963-t1 [Saitoella complicata NRRL Y-17804]
MPKERTLNPALAKHKADKQRQIRAGKTQQRKAQDERYAKRNPERIRAQIAELKASSEGAGLGTGDRRVLEGLEGELRKIERARTAAGISTAPAGERLGRGEGRDGERRERGPIIESDRTKEQDRSRRERQERRERNPPKPRIPKDPKKSIYYDPVFNPYGVPPPGMPYREIGQEDKREQEGGDGEYSDADSTTSSVLAIPMPPGTPPRLSDEEVSDDEEVDIPMPQQREPKEEKNKEEVETGPVQAVYEAAPVLRDLQKETIAAGFVPAAVRRHMPVSRPAVSQVQADVVVRGGQGLEKKGVNAAPEVDEEYDAFMKEMKGLL